MKAKKKIFRCDVCNLFEYDLSKGQPSNGIAPGTVPEDFPHDWSCPVCASNKTHLIPFPEEPAVSSSESIEKQTAVSEETKGYPSELMRTNDPTECQMDDIHKMAVTGRSIIEPMRTTKKVIGWDDLLIMAAQLAKIPLNDEDEVATKTVIGPNAKHPMVIDTPIYVTHMSFGELSKELKISLAKGTAAVKTAMCSGEGGILEETISIAHQYIFEYVTNRYSVNDENLKRVDAVEIKIGQSAKPGMGGSLPGSKVTEEVAKMRNCSPGIDISSPASYEDIRNK
ncbi:MAG TPA: glutamate synthase, partial [Actinobacteria bacterium]|nr:glutamate synthase [Actinomycetota bacterium]